MTPSFPVVWIKMKKEPLLRREAAQFGGILCGWQSNKSPVTLFPPRTPAGNILRECSLSGRLHSKAALNITHCLGIQPQTLGQILHILDFLYGIHLNSQE